jgi:hypothetical protein
MIKKSRRLRRRQRKSRKMRGGHGSLRRNLTRLFSTSLDEFNAIITEIHNEDQTEPDNVHANIMTGRYVPRMYGVVDTLLDRLLHTATGHVNSTLDLTQLKQKYLDAKENDISIAIPLVQSTLTEVAELIGTIGTDVRNTVTPQNASNP